MKNLWAVGAGLAAATVLAWLPPPAGADNNRPTLDDIRRTWQERQGKIRSARFEYACKGVIHKGASSMLGMPGKPGGDSGSPSPSQDLPADGTGSVVLRGDNLRHSAVMPAWDPLVQAVFRQRRLDTFDGRLFKYLEDPSTGEKDSHPVAKVMAVDRSESAGYFPILPLLVWLRGDSPRFFNDLPRYEVTDRTVTVGQRRCRELVAESRSRNRREVLYLDESRGFVVTRKATLIDGKPTWQLDVSYTLDREFGWVPQSWEYIIRASKDGPVHESGRRSITRYEINGTVADTEFDIAFPPGTRVFDQSAGKGVQHVVREDGSEGRRIRTSAGPTYQELQRPEPLRAATVLIIFSVVVAVVASSALLWARRRGIGRTGQ